MTDDLVKRLRDWKGIRMSPEKMAHFIAVAQEAADALERLQTQVDLLLSYQKDIESAAGRKAS